MYFLSKLRHVLTVIVSISLAGLFSPPNLITSNPGPTRYGQLPLSFIANAGQFESAARFQVRSSGGTLSFASDAVMLNLADTSNAPVDIRIDFEGANPNAAIDGSDLLPGVANFFIGNDSARWHTNVPTYAGVVYRDLYPGVELRYGGHAGLLKGTYTLPADADPAVIRWRYFGANSVSIDSLSGDLRIGMSSGGTLLEKAPIAWQMHDGTQQSVSVNYRLDADGTAGFALGDYNHALPLIIDPGLDYSTYLSNGADQGNAIAVDSQGNAYITGFTVGGFPTTASTLQNSFGGGSADVFVTKLNAMGTNVVYSTYLGGSGDDYGNGIALDSSGNVYITGQTTSANFPVTAGAYQAAYAGGTGHTDVFVSKLNATGNSLVYSTFLGGYSDEAGRGIALDATGNAYIVGQTFSSDFPITPGVLQSALGAGTGQSNAFVSKLNATGTTLVYSTYLGGNGSDDGRAIVVDSTGSAYVTGGTQSANFPVIAGSYQTTFGGGTDDVFVSKLNPTGTMLVYSTYLGGSGGEHGNGIALDSSGSAYITGPTTGSFPTTAGAYQTAYGGGVQDAFVSKLNATGTNLSYSTYLGAMGAEIGRGIALDSSGSAYITGNTASDTFPITADAYQTTFGGGVDAFVSALNPVGSALLYSTYLGGNMSDYGNAIALDNSASMYVTGSTAGHFPTTAGAYLTNGRGVFVSKLNRSALPTATPTLSATNTLSATPMTFTPTPTLSATNTLTPTPTLSATYTTTPITFTPTPSLTATSTLTATPVTFTATPSRTTTATATASITPPTNATLTNTTTPGATVSLNTPTVTLTGTNGSSPTLTTTASSTSTMAPTHIDTIGIFRSGTFYLRLANSTGFSDLTVAFSPASQPYPIVGDWTGIGYDTVGIYDQSNGLFLLCTANDTLQCSDGVNVLVLVLGNPGDLPLAGRWQPGVTTSGVGVFRPSNGLIYLKNGLTTGFADDTMVLGIPGDVGLAGDWNGKGFDSPGVYRPSSISFYLSNKVTNGPVFGDYQLIYGVPGDVPVNGDWSAQGYDGVGLFRPTNGYTYLRNALSTGFADLTFVYGIAGDIPVAGHWQPIYPIAPTPGVVIVPPTPTATRAPIPTMAPSPKKPGPGDG